MNRETLRWAGLPGGVRIPYTDTGPAATTPVLLLHGWGESRRVFDRLLADLPGSLRVIAFDQRGHGDADKPATGYSLEAMAGDVLAFMDALGIGSAVLAGSSSGGYLAQQVAITGFERVAGLVLIGAPLDLRGRPAFADEVERLTDPVDAAWVRASLDWFPLYHPVPRWFIEDRVHDGTRVPATVWRATLDGLCAAVPPTEGGTIGCPTLILWGTSDALLGPEQPAGLAAAISGSRLVGYAGTGHLVLWESPGRIAADLVTFVAALQ